MVDFKRSVHKLPKNFGSVAKALINDEWNYFVVTGWRKRTMAFARDPWQVLMTLPLSYDEGESLDPIK